MKILAITKRLPTTSPDRIAALQVPEAKMVWELMKGDFIREVAFDRGRPCVLLTLEAASIEDAKMRLAPLPMVREQQIDFDFYVMGPYTQLANAFQTE